MHDVRGSRRKLEVACKRHPGQEDTSERETDQHRDQTQKHSQKSHSELVSENEKNTTRKCSELRVATVWM